MCALCWTLIACSVKPMDSKQLQQLVPKPFVLGETDSLYSTHLNESRILNIYLPQNYSADSSTTFPVIYLFDGSADEDFVHVAGVVQFLTMIGSIPPHIVVGIGNVDRRRDFTFPSNNKLDKEELPTSGGSEKFISFIENELEPFIDVNYKTNSSRTVIGQSLGGLLASEILLKKPSMFNDYIIVSPSLWWDDESLLKVQSDFSKGNVRFVDIMVGGLEEPEMISASKKLADLLSKDQKMHLFHSVLKNEDHLSILHNAVYDALMLKFKSDVH